MRKGNCNVNVNIRLEKAVIDDPDFYAAWGWINMKAICLSLMTNLYSQPYNLTSLTRTQNPQEVTGFSYSFYFENSNGKGLLYFRVVVILLFEFCLQRRVCRCQ